MEFRQFLMKKGAGVVGPLITLGLVLCLFAPAAGAEELSADAIIDKSLENNTLGFSDAVMQVTLTLISKRGTERTRQIEIRSMEDKEITRTLVRFHAPADVAGTGFLRFDKKDADDDQYLYLPALGKVKRITGSQRNQRFMGTDLTYADLESRDLKNSTIKRLADAKLGGNAVYVIEAFPKDKGDSQYGKTLTWIHKKSFVPLKTEFYDKRLKLLKTLKVKRLEKKDGHWVAMDSRIENVQKKTRTRMLINSVQFNVKLGAGEFTQRALSGG